MRVVKNQKMHELLVKNHLNLTDLGEMIGVPRDAMSRRNTGRTAWLWPEVCAICDILGITPDEFRQIYPSGNPTPTIKEKQPMFMGC